MQITSSPSADLGFTARQKMECEPPLLAYISLSSPFCHSTKATFHKIDANLRHSILYLNLSLHIAAIIK